ncbi:MAG: Peptidase and in kexin sedolisin [Phycisphaerales bacterium]|nr:Peptidase and in kexin sedolisin [Phycisphaerales bacterium]
MGTNQYRGSASMAFGSKAPARAARGGRRPAGDADRRLSAAAATVCERLEARQLMAATPPVAVVTDPTTALRTLTVTATKKSDTIDLARSGDGLVVTLNGTATTTAYADFDAVVVYAGSGNDVVSVSDNLAVEGEDFVPVGPVTVRGGSGNDKITGGAGDDFLYGDGGSDLLVGAAGGDTLDGGSGNDRLSGGVGKDKLVGGSGKNVFNAGGDAGDTDDSGLSKKNLLSTTASRPTLADAANPLAVFGTQTGLTPTQIRTQYAFGNLADSSYTNRGAGQGIAVVIPYNVSGVRTSVNTFSTQFGLPQVDANSLPIIFAGGTTPPEDPDPNNGWEAEACLQLEWAHAIAPEATLYLVLADSDLFTDLFKAVDTAVDTLASRNGGGVCLMSFGSQTGELNGPLQTYLDQSFTRRAAQSVTFVSGAGDVAGTTSYPSTSPYVVSVGGTSLVRDTAGNLTGQETAWSLGGGGYSTIYPAPAYQEDVTVNGVVIRDVNYNFGESNTVVKTPIVNNNRGTPDIAFNADPNSGIALYVAAGFGDVDGDGTLDSGWLPGGAGGTSAGSPEIAGLIALANQQRRAAGRSFIGINFNDAFYDIEKAAIDPNVVVNPAGGNQPQSYTRDIVTGASGTNQAFVGYDLVTGWGSPLAQALIDRLATAAVKPIALGGLRWEATYRDAIVRTGPLSSPGGGFMVGDGAISGNNVLQLVLTPRPNDVPPYPANFFNQNAIGGNGSTNPNEFVLPPGNIVVSNLVVDTPLVRTTENSFVGYGQVDVTILQVPLAIPRPVTSGSGAADDPLPPPPVPVLPTPVPGTYDNRTNFDVQEPVTVPTAKVWTFRLRFTGKITRDAKGREHVKGFFTNGSEDGSWNPKEGYDPVFEGTFQG